MGNTEILNQLKDLKIEVFELEHGYIGFKYKIPIGKFRNQEIVIALNAPQFPNVPPSGPYIKPFLLPINTSIRVAPLGGIHRRNKPTADFQYWSRPFPNWNGSEKSMKSYLAFLRTLFDFEDEV